MAQQYKRIIRVSITGVERTFTYPELEINFAGNFDNNAEPNDYSVNIYNLGQESVSLINRTNAITLSAGYENDVGIISAGVITRVETDTSSVDKLTTIEFQDASSQWLNVNVSRTFTGPITASEVLRQITQNIDLEIGQINLVNNITYQNGKTVVGKLSNVIKKIVRETNSSVTIRNGKIDITASSTGFETGFILNNQTGLINIDKLDDKDSQAEYKLNMLMNHRIRPKSILQIESTKVQGLFFVIEGKYNNDFTITAEVARLV